MPSRFLLACAGLLLAAAFVQPAAAQRQKLKVGSPAPPLSVETWVRADDASFQSIQNGYVYVVEFWATWCAPCRRSIPKLHAMQEAFGPDGLRVIGVSTEESRTVESFVGRMGPTQMDYAVAVDAKDKTKRAWMDAADLNGIPSMFIVDRTGVIQFIGSPFDPDLETILPLVLMDRYDAQLFRATVAKRNAIRQARERGDYRQAERWIGEVVELEPKVFYPLALENVKMKMVDMKDMDAGYAAAEQYASLYEDDGIALYVLAQMILNDPDLANEDRRIDVAETIAGKAASKMDSSDPRAHSIRAAVAFRKGEFDKAVRLQRRAWRMARPFEKEEFERQLAAYQSARDEARSGM